MRILMFTYRFGKELVGGPEHHLWCLAEQMARMGCRIDVATTLQSELTTVGRFGERWSESGQKPFEAVSVKGASHPIQIHRFPVKNLPGFLRAVYQRLLWRRWESEELKMEPSDPIPATFEGKVPLFLTGWHQPDLMDDGNLVRWSMERASVQLPETRQSALHLQGFAPRQLTVEFERLGKKRVVYRGKGSFQITVKLTGHPRETVGVLHVSPASRPLRDARTLGIRLSHLSLSSQGRIYLAPFHVDHRTLRSVDKEKHIRTCMERAKARPAKYSRLFDAIRGPRCAGMVRFLKSHYMNYDWVLAGVLPWATLPAAVEVRRRTPFRLAALPLFHVDDEFYYWEHYLEAMRGADVCLANSGFSNEVFFPMVGARSFTTGAGVNETLFRKSSISGRRFRKDFGFGEDEKIILSVGRKSRAKLYRRVAKAVHNIQHRRKCRFVLVGPDEDLLGISYPSTSYLGVLSEDDLLDAYDACDVFCLMSESESFGIPFVEAWMREKPVIGNRNCAPVANLIRDGENGLLASTREELEERLVELLNDPDRCGALGKAGLERALRNHTWQVIARKILDRLEGMTGG